MMKGFGKSLQKPNSNCIFLRVVAKGISFLLWDIPENKQKKDFIFWINTPAKKLILHLYRKTHHKERKCVLKVYHMKHLHKDIDAFGLQLYMYKTCCKVRP